jgi:hypothetical protein
MPAVAPTVVLHRHGSQPPTLLLFHKTKASWVETWIDEAAQGIQFLTEKRVQAPPGFLHAFSTVA